MQTWIPVQSDDHLELLTELRTLSGKSAAQARLDVVGEAELHRLLPQPKYTYDPDTGVTTYSGRTIVTLSRMGNIGSLIYPVGEARAFDLYVQAAIHPGMRAATLLGWCWADDLVRWGNYPNKEDTHHRLPVSSLWRMNGLLQDIERVNAEEYARMLLIDYQTLPSGQRIETRWWTDRESASVVVEGKGRDYIYKTNHPHQGEQWHRIADPYKLTYRTWKAARDGAITALIDGEQIRPPIHALPDMTQQRLIDEVRAAVDRSYQ